MRRVFGITWQDKFTNNDAVNKAGIPSMFTLLRQRRVHLLGHMHMLDDGRITKDVLFGELSAAKR